MVSRTTLTRLDWAIFALRWLFVVGVFALALTMPLLYGEEGLALRGPMMAAGALGVLVGLLGGVPVLFEMRGSGAMASVLAIDCVYALLVYWLSGGMIVVLIALSMLPIIVGSLRIAPLVGPGFAMILAAMAPLIFALFIAQDTYAGMGEAFMGSAILLLMGGVAAAPVQAANMGWRGRSTMLKEREVEAMRLRTAREQANAVYEMASTLSATLNYQAVLDAALDVGVLGLREMGPHARLVSTVLLFDQDTGYLRVANARRLTHSDISKQVPGRQGILATALQKAEPVIASDARRDPELRFFVAFQDARSILCVPLRAGFDNFGVLLFGSTIPKAFSEEYVELLSAIASQATIALQNAALYQNLLEEKERIIDVEEDARKQLSRNLHDGPTQSVAAIAMRVNYIRRLLERDPTQVPSELEKVEDLARKTTKEIRHMLFTLRPLVLETQGLIPALQELAKKLSENYDQHVLVQAQDNIAEILDANDQNVLFNIVDECVNNARKHAEAEHIWVRLSRKDNYLLMEVQDDGVGFDMGEVGANYDQRGSLGMINLRERAELLDGTLRIDSDEGKGTKISLIVSLDRYQPQDTEAKNERPTNQTTSLKRRILPPTKEVRRKQIEQARQNDPASTRPARQLPRTRNPFEGQ